MFNLIFNGMKKFLKFLSFVLISGIATYSCTDEFNEKDAMEALQLVSLQVAVHDASNSDAALSGVTVKAVIDTMAVTATTNPNGIAVFEDLKIGGNINIYVSKEGYTTVFTSVNTTPNDYRQTVIGSNVYMYSTTGDNVVTIKGQLTIETNVTNRQREYVSDVEVLAYNGSLGNTERFFVGTTDATGNYSIVVPVDDNGGNSVYVYFPSLERSRTVGRNINNVYSIETKTAYYYPSNYAETAIDRVPSTLISIAAPPASGSGFLIGLKAERSSLSAAVDNEFVNEVIINGGSGYNGTENFVFAADPDGNKAELNVTVSGDVITSMNFIDNGATYSSMPAIESSPTNGSGAVFDFRFRYRYKLYIANSGSGYLSFPVIGADYTTTLDNTSKLRKEYDPDINSGAVLGTNLFSNAFLTGGAIKVKDETNGDTLFTTGYLYSMPVFTYGDEDRQRAEWYANLGAVSTNDSTLSDNFSNNTQGDGYDYENPPAVTVTALAGYGSGAVVKSEVNSSGAVTDLIVMVKGSGYTQDINDYDGDGNYNEEEDAEMYGFSTWSTGYGRHDNVKRGMTYVGNVFYGTGMEKTP